MGHTTASTGQRFSQLEPSDAGLDHHTAVAQVYPADGIEAPEVDNNRLCIDR